jgi:hypothetical protein
MNLDDEVETAAAVIADLLYLVPADKRAPCDRPRLCAVQHMALR